MPPPTGRDGTVLPAVNRQANLWCPSRWRPTSCSRFADRSARTGRSRRGAWAPRRLRRLRRARARSRWTNRRRSSCCRLLVYRWVDVLRSAMPIGWRIVIASSRRSVNLRYRVISLNRPGRIRCGHRKVKGIRGSRRADQGLLASRMEGSYRGRWRCSQIECGVLAGLGYDSPRSSVCAEDQVSAAHEFYDFAAKLPGRQCLARQFPQTSPIQLQKGVG